MNTAAVRSRRIPFRIRVCRWLVPHGIEASLPQLVDKPMLIAWGGRDWCFNDAFFEEWLRRFPKAESLHVSQAGHYLLEDAGDEIIPAIGRFLGGDREGGTPTEQSGGRSP